MAISKKNPAVKVSREFVEARIFEAIRWVKAFRKGGDANAGDVTQVTLDKLDDSEAMES